ncbi:MAG TPA: hypothetical protein VNU97_09890 [Rhizomicrobium sp.]|jgi:hypothetical protein|nr:hypothetical protein [Rhizomicrobium sp.]
MSISRDEAAETLRNIQQAQSRSFTAYGYKSAAPFFFIWGVVWWIGYSANDLVPAYGGRIWPALLLLAFIASAVFGRRSGRGDDSPAARDRNRRIGLRMLATWIAVFAYIAAVTIVMRPATSAQESAFVPLLVAAAYTVLGVWMGVRFVIAGLAIGVLTLGGFFFLHGHFELWMAAVGGTTLIVTGFWLRRA